MDVTANKKLFSVSFSVFSQIIPYLKVQKTCIDSPKTLQIPTKMVTKTELVNTRNNEATITVTNIPNKRNIKIGRFT